MRNQYDLEWFIDTVVLGDIHRLIFDDKQYYLSFLPMACGVQFLGACLDSQPFTQYNLARQRFESAIVRLFPPEYHKYATAESKHDLYEKLFVGMTHGLRPGKGIDLTAAEESRKEGTEHLELHPDNPDDLVLVAEVLFAHLANACEYLKENMRKGIYTKQLTDSYLAIDE